MVTAVLAAVVAGAVVDVATLPNIDLIPSPEAAVVAAGAGVDVPKIDDPVEVPNAEPKKEPPVLAVVVVVATLEVVLAAVEAAGAGAAEVAVVPNPAKIEAVVAGALIVVGGVAVVFVRANG